jgi:hypothetical protein
MKKGIIKGAILAGSTVIALGLSITEGQNSQLGKIEKSTQGALLPPSIATASIVIREDAASIIKVENQTPAIEAFYLSLYEKEDPSLDNSSVIK